MLIRFFKNNNPASFILLPLFALGLWMASFFSQQDRVIKYSMPLYDMVAKPLNSAHFIATLIAFILIVSEAFLLNYIVNENEILTKPSFLPALFYIVFMSNDRTMLMLYPLLFANFFILLAIHKLVSSYRKDSAFSNAFDAGILFSLATLFYFPGIVFIPLLGIAFVLFRPFNWREWIISFLGVMLPYLFVFTYYFWNGMLVHSQVDKMVYPHLSNQAKLDFSQHFYFILGVGWLLVLFSLGKLFTGSPETSQKNKKSIRLLLWFSAFALISVLIAKEISIQSFSALAIPSSVFCANYFLKIKKAWWGELLFLLLLVSVVINQLSS
jgi:hypothetical protein